MGWGGQKGGVEIGSRPTARAVVKIPPVGLVGGKGKGGGKTRKVDVIVLSDGYVGMEWRVMGVEVPVPVAPSPSPPGGPETMVLEEGSGGLEKGGSGGGGNGNGKGGEGSGQGGKGKGR